MVGKVAEQRVVDVVEGVQLVAAMAAAKAVVRAVVMAA